MPVMSNSQIEQGSEWLEELLSLAKIPTSAMARQEEDSYWLTINESNLSAEEISILIGVDGIVLDAIQYLANAILNIGKELDEQAAYTVELHGYRSRRLQELKLMADYAASQVRLTGFEYELASLSSAERRQVHNMLKDCEDLETYSRGQEPDRRLVVRMKI